MKMMNDMELIQVTGGYLDTKGGVSDEEYELIMGALDNMVSGIGNALYEGYSIVKYILFR